MHRFGRTIPDWLNRHRRVASMSWTEGRRYQLPNHQQCRQVSKDDCLNLSLMIGNRLLELMTNQESPQWFTIVESWPEGRLQWNVRPLGGDLYDGLPGVALFLGLLGTIAKDETFRTVAERIVDRWIDDSSGNEGDRVGAFDGTAGLIYVLTVLGTTWGETRYLKHAIILARRLKVMAAPLARVDFMAGAAGCVPVLAGLASASQSGEPLVAAGKCAEKLFAHVERITLRSAGATAIQSGLAHGASGIAYALLISAACNDRPRFAVAAAKAIDSETSVLFSPDQQNWATRSQRTPRFQLSWCGGAPGIGMIRSWVVDRFATSEIALEEAIAVHTTWDGGFGRNHGLCCGDFGNLELLRLSGCEGKYTERLTQLIESIQLYGPICGTPTPVRSEVPGLMRGLAGVGYGLLRHVNSAVTPCVLRLEMPTTVLALTKSPTSQDLPLVHPSM